MGDRETNRKENGEEGVNQGSTDGYGYEPDPYDRAKRLWGEFIQGKITSEQLDQTINKSK